MGGVAAKADASEGAGAADSGPPLVEARDVCKNFGGVRAVADASVAIGRASIHGLVGENGAGKSTLGKMIAGVHMPDAGELLVDGRVVHYRSPHDALKDGLTMIAQELALVPKRTVIENVFLGVETRRFGVVNRRSLRARFDELNDQTGFGLRGDALVGSLRVADQQKVEIMRAIARNARLIVMDEPTAALTVDEAEKLFEIVRRLRTEGTTLVYVSHFLQEVLDLVDSVTVMKDGRLVRTARAADETVESLVTAMLGRSLDVTFPEKAFPPEDANVALEVADLTRAGVIEDISLTVRAGEIVGMAGLIGSGRSEVARAIFGADPIDRGTVRLNGREVKIKSPRHAKRLGIALLPESRKDQGLIMTRPIFENVTLPHLSDVSVGSVVVPRREEGASRDELQKVDARYDALSAPVTTLSGGNQQKVLFAKWLFRRPAVLLADEPTRGVDVGAKKSIYDLITALAADGMGVLLISSELEEVLGLAHRVLVMRGGRIVAEFDGRTVTEDAVMRAAFATDLAEEAA
jgi:ABC-type sugar transport system ATPase subunit